MNCPLAVIANLELGKKEGSQEEVDSIFFLRFYLFIHEKDRERERQRHRQRKKQASCREPDVGLDPGSPGSRPGLQAALNRCSTRAAQYGAFLKNK